MKKIKKLDIEIYTDGACSGNPGPGGWASLLIIKGDKSIKNKKILLKGGERHSTNNKMELKAVIKALQFIIDNFIEYELNINVYSDSSYVVNPINQGWLEKWKKNNWIKLKGEEVVNKDLWLQMVDLLDILQPKFYHIKGHSGHKYNDKVDGVANKESNKYKQLKEI